MTIDRRRVVGAWGAGVTHRLSPPVGEVLPQQQPQLRPHRHGSALRLSEFAHRSLCVKHKVLGSKVT